MKWTSVVLAGLSLIVGLAAAWFWFDSSRVQPEPGPGIDSGERAIQDQAWIGALIVAANKSARLNKIAAILTAVAVVLGTASSVSGAFG